MKSMCGLKARKPHPGKGMGFSDRSVGRVVRQGCCNVPHAGSNPAPISYYLVNENVIGAQNRVSGQTSHPSGHVWLRYLLSTLHRERNWNAEGGLINRKISQPGAFRSRVVS